MEQNDLESIVGIAAQIHNGLPEREEVFAEKLRLYPAGCHKLLHAGAPVGYGIAHPWRLHSVPPLDTFLEKLPEHPECFYIHDIAILPAGRGQGASGTFLKIVQAQAVAAHVPSLALVSVYGTSLFWGSFGFTVDHDPSCTAKIACYGPTARYMTCLAANLR